MIWQLFHGMLNNRTSFYRQAFQKDLPFIINRNFKLVVLSSNEIDVKLCQIKNKMNQYWIYIKEES